MYHQPSIEPRRRRNLRRSRTGVHVRFDERRSLSAVFGESTVRQWRGW